MIGERLIRARSASGISLRDLGLQVGVAHSMIKKYEDNRSMPNSSMLVKLAKALGVRSEYFFRPNNIQLGEVEYRKNASVSKQAIKRIEADVLDQAERWLELANLWPNYPIKPFSIPENLPDHLFSYQDVDSFANKVRNQWNLGSNPIADLVDELETRGILVIFTKNIDHAKFDGLHAMVGGQPILVTCLNLPGDRQRFTLAHELGHLLLEGRISGLDEEMACHRFAASFLLPAESARQHLGVSRTRIEDQELYLLKHEFGISMAACVYRAFNLDIISESTKTKIQKKFSFSGWRKVEPGKPYPQETTYLFKQLVFRALGEDIIGESKAAELLGISLMKLNQLRKLELPNATLDK